MSTSIAKKIAIATLGLAGAFGAAAHVPEGSPLMRYKGFINHMSKVGSNYPGGCCHLNDGQGNLKERQETDADGKVHYFVTLTEDFQGNALPNPVEVAVPDNAVLTGKWANDFCNKLKREQPESPDAATCNAPPVNIIWTSQYSGSMTETMRASGNKIPSFQIYCYWPQPRLM